MGITFHGHFNKADFKVNDKHPVPHLAGEPLDSPGWFSYFDFTSKKEEKEIYLLCGMPKGMGWPILVKVQCVAEVSKNQYDNYKFSCTVIEIDGVSITKKERQVCCVERSNPISSERQINVLREALEEAKILGTPIRVSEQYIKGHMHLARLQRGIQRRVEKRR